MLLRLEPVATFGIQRLVACRLAGPCGARSMAVPRLGRAGCYIAGTGLVARGQRLRVPAGTRKSQHHRTAGRLDIVDDLALTRRTHKTGAAASDGARDTQPARIKAQADLKPHRRDADDLQAAAQRDAMAADAPAARMAAAKAGERRAQR